MKEKDLRDLCRSNRWKFWETGSYDKPSGKSFLQFHVLMRNKEHHTIDHQAPCDREVMAGQMMEILSQSKRVQP